MVEEQVEPEKKSEGQSMRRDSRPEHVTYERNVGVALLPKSVEMKATEPINTNMNQNMFSAILS